MSTASRDRDPRRTGIELITDSEGETVTFVADLDDDSVVPTQWITAATDDLVDVESRR